MKKKIKIPLMVGSNGKWSCFGYEGQEVDWAMIADCLDHEGKFPEVEKKFFVEVEIEVPSAEPESIAGEVISEEGVIPTSWSESFTESKQSVSRSIVLSETPFKKPS